MPARSKWPRDGACAPPLDPRVGRQHTAVVMSHGACGVPARDQQMVGDAAARARQQEPITERQTTGGLRAP